MQGEIAKGGAEIMRVPIELKICKGSPFSSCALLGALLTSRIWVLETVVSCRVGICCRLTHSNQHIGFVHAISTAHRSFSS
jgi:hypothetical protein